MLRNLSNLFAIEMKAQTPAKADSHRDRKDSADGPRLLRQEDCEQQGGIHNSPQPMGFAGR